MTDAAVEGIAEVMRYDNRTLKVLRLQPEEHGGNISYALKRKIDRLAQINSESVGCSDKEVGRKKRAEFGPTVDEIYRFVRSKPYLLSV